MKKKVVIWILATIAGIIIIALLLLPGFLKKYAVNNGKELIGRQISLDKLKINYFTGTVRLMGFNMFEANEQDSFIAFDTLLIDTRPFHLFNNKLVVQQFYLKGLKTNIIQNDSVFNFDDLIAFYGAESDTISNQDESSSENFKFEISNIELKKAELVYADIPLNKTLKTNDLNLFIPYISWDQEHSSEAGLKFYFENGGFFESDIEVDPNNGDFNAQIIIDQLELSPFYEYSLDYTNLGSLSGKLNTNLRLTGNTDHPEKLIISGTFELLDLLTTDQRNEPFINIKHVFGSLKKIDYYHEYYAFDSLKLVEPYFYIEFYDTTLNVIEVIDYYSYFPPESDEENDEEINSAVQTEDDETVTSTLYYGFDHVSIVNGKMDLVDRTTGEPFQYYLSEMEMSADSIYSNSDWVTLYSTMLLNNRGKLVAEVGFWPEDPMDISMDYVITDFLMSDLNIYSRHYMGVPILYGDMYYKSTTKILKGQLSSENKLVIHNAEVGDKRGGLYNLPLKFALFLLKDRQGVIDLDIPVRGDLNDPKVSIGKIVWNTLKNLIIKVAAAPFDFLARVISVDPKDIQSIEYTYLDTAFTAERQRQIDLLLELEQKKEELEIELVYFNDVEREKKQIVVEEAGKLFELESGKNYRTNEKEFIEFLKGKTETDSVEIVTASFTLIPSERVDSIAKLFAQTRRAGIENYLHKMSDSTAIKVFIPDPRSPKNAGSEPRFEVKYSIEGMENSDDQ
jgi:hypothetical protein